MPVLVSLEAFDARVLQGILLDYLGHTRGCPNGRLMQDLTASVEIHWRVGSPDQFAWSKLDDDAWVVYHRPSGKTHFVNSVTADLLNHVLASPRTARAAAEELAEREGAVANPQFFATVAESLRHLEHVGLIQRCDP